MELKKVLAALCIALGIAILAVLFYYHYFGVHETKQLMEDFTEAVEEKQDEETTDEKEEQTTLGETDAAILRKAMLLPFWKLRH